MQKNSEEIREDKLAELIRQNNPVAMRTLYNRYVRFLTAICSRYLDNEDDVSDVLQDAFIKIFSSIGNFVYLGNGSLKNWLAKITINETLRFIKLKGRLDFVSIDDEYLNIENEEPEIDDVPLSVIQDIASRIPHNFQSLCFRRKIS